MSQVLDLSRPANTPGGVVAASFRVRLWMIASAARGWR